MKKTSKIFLSFIMAATVILGVTGCSEEKVSLTNKTIHGVSIDIPDDFKDFTEKDGAMMATNEDSTASISISPVEDINDVPVEVWTEESFEEAMLSAYSESKLLEFKSNTKISGLTTIYTHYTVKNANDVDTEAYTYIIYHNEETGKETAQIITLAYNKNNKNSLQDNIDAIKSGISIK